MQATYVQTGARVDYTPGSAVSAGDVVLIGTIPMIATQGHRGQRSRFS
jgi:predicted RecA/RadA family phage recombinase